MRMSFINKGKLELFVGNDALWDFNLKWHKSDALASPGLGTEAINK